MASKIARGEGKGRLAQSIREASGRWTTGRRRRGGKEPGAGRTAWVSRSGGCRRYNNPWRSTNHESWIADRNTLSKTQHRWI